MILFAFPAYTGLAEGLRKSTGMRRGDFTVERFPNGELYVKVQTDVADQCCVILGSVSPPDAQMLATLLFCHTLKKDEARRVTVLLPYLAYARQDRNQRGESRAAAWLGELLGASGANEVVTIDVHSPSAQALFAIPLVSLSPALLFAGSVATGSLRDATLVAPDEGALPRCHAFKQAAGLQRPIAWFSKIRTGQGVRSTLRGEVGTQAVVIDDILDTGATLVACCRILRDAGVKEITVLVTHGLFQGSLWRRLPTLGVRRIHCTDSVPLFEEADPDLIAVSSILPLLKAHFRGATLESV